MYKKLAALLIASVMISSTAFGQLYKADYATKLVLAGNGGPGLPTAISLLAPAVGSSYSLTLPTTVGSNGYILTSDGTGNLIWTNPSIGVTLGGDVTGAAGSNTVVKINGNSLGSTTPISGNLLIADGSQWSSVGVTGDVTIDGLGVTTIGAGKVTYAKIQNVGAASLLGNPTGSATTASEITLDQTLKFSGTTLGFDLNHSNTWTSGQNVQDVQFRVQGTGALIVESGSGFSFEGHGAAPGYVMTTSTGNGDAQWTNLATFGVTTLSGTADQVYVNNVLGPTTGAITLTLPQSIATTSSPSFAGLTVNTFGTAGVVHNAAGGALSSSLIVDGDITAGTIANNKLANSSFQLNNSDGSLNAPGTINLGDAVDVSLNTAHGNDWTAGQNFNGVHVRVQHPGAQLVVDADADFAYEGHNAAPGYVLSSVTGNGNASWVNLATLGVTTAIGTPNEILVNGDDNVAHGGPITLTTPQPIGTTSDVTFGSATLGNLAFSQPVHSDASGKLVSGAINLAGGATEVSGTLPVANGGTNSNTALVGSSIMVATGGKIVQGQAGTTATVLHGNASGVPSYGQIVDADIATATISNASLATPTFEVVSNDASLNVPGANSQIGGTQNVTINTAHDNTWSSNQTITGASHSLTVDATADFALEGHNAAAGNVLTSDANGVATWTDLSTVGVTSVQGTANQVYVNGVLTPEVGAVVLTLPQSIAPTSTVTFNDMFLTNLLGGGVVHSDGNGHLFNNTVNLGSGLDVSGVLPLSYGGTGSGSFNANEIVIANPAGNALISGGAGTSSTVLHGNASGAPSYGQIVDADIATGTIANNKLAHNTIAVGSTGSSLVVTGSPIALGGTAGNVEINTAHSNTWSAGQTFAATSYSTGGSTVLSSNPTHDFAIGTNSSVYKINSASNLTLDGLTDGSTGRMVTLINTGTSYITIPSATGSAAGNQFSIAGGDDIIMGPGATATFMYVGTSWTLVSGF